MNFWGLNFAKTQLMDVLGGRTHRIDFNFSPRYLGGTCSVSVMLAASAAPLTKSLLPKNVYIWIKVTNELFHQLYH